MSSLRARTDSTVSTSERVVEAVAAHAGVDPLDLDTVLHDVIDPDALDALVEGADADLELTFTFDDYLVSVRGDGRVDVQATETLYR